jgi:hypothetical protein
MLLADYLFDDALYRMVLVAVHIKILSVYENGVGGESYRVLKKAVILAAARIQAKLMLSLVAVWINVALV